MQKLSRSIYQTARNSAGITQEESAERLCISVESLRAYERKATVPPADIVLSMIELYSTPSLGYLYLKLDNPVGQKYLPDIEFRDLPSSVLVLQKEMNDVEAVKDDMIDAACDGNIDKTEHPRWKNKIMTEISHLAGAALSMMFTPLQKGKAVTRAVK